VRAGKSGFSQQRNKRKENQYTLLFTVNRRFEWYIKVGQKVSNRGLDGFARKGDDCVSCLT